MPDQLTELCRTTVSSVGQTEGLGRLLAGALCAGDLLILDGPLGAGKTAFTRGIGSGLNIAGPVTSPTFVIARVHPSLDHGPALVHVDAYRIEGLDDLETLDLDASVEAAITVVEWGAGRVESLLASFLRVDLELSSTNEDERTIVLRTAGHFTPDRVAALRDVFVNSA